MSKEPVNNLMFNQLEEEKVFKDPVHRYIHVTDRLIWELINTPEFQRLRYIRQLGTTYVTFHGAEHSRFSHSLGVYEIMRRILENFSENSLCPEEDRLLCLSAALLHDVGHGPFSHTFEKVFQTDHEEWTQAIVQGNTEIHRILQKVSGEFPSKVSAVINKTSKNKLATSLISSQMDADRMDYLLRDAYFTGVNYGFFDLECILRVMRLHEEGVVFKRSGMHAVEDYIMSRYHMYWQVYFHPVTRSSEVLLCKIFRRAKHLCQLGYGFMQDLTLLYPLLTDKMNLQDYLRLNEALILHYFQLWQDEKDMILADLSRRFIQRQLFKYVAFDPATQMEKWTELTQLFKEIKIDPEYYLEIDSPSDSPYDFYRSDGEGVGIPLLLLMSSGDLRELSKESDIVRAIAGKKQTDHQLFFPLDLLEKAEPRSKNIQRIKALLDLDY